MPTTRYQILFGLGSGKTADVLLAVRLVSARPSKLVVLKVLKSELANSPEYANRLVREARICARMNHPNIVVVDELESLDGLPAIVMEYVHGHSLESVLHRGLGKAPVEVFLQMLAAALGGLHHAHELTLVNGLPLVPMHGHLTPQDIMVTYDGSIKVLGFGKSRVALPVHTASESTDYGYGLRYMAPEHLTGDPLDRRTDLFAVGIILTELVTGCRFWGNLNDTTVVKWLESGDIPMPQRVFLDCPSELERICAKALAADPNRRYQSAAEMQLALEMYLCTRAPHGVTTFEMGQLIREWFALEGEGTRRLIASGLGLEPCNPPSRPSAAISPTQAPNAMFTTACAR